MDLGFINAPPSNERAIIDHCSKPWLWPAPHSGANAKSLGVGIGIDIGFGIAIEIAIDSRGISTNDWFS
jgi:hypothetical protein